MPVRRLIDLMDNANVGVDQRGGRLSFTKEALFVFFVFEDESDRFRGVTPRRSAVEVVGNQDTNGGTRLPILH